MGLPVEQEHNVELHVRNLQAAEPHVRDSQAAKHTASPSPLQQKRPVAGLLGPPIYFQPTPGLRPAIRSQSTQFQPSDSQSGELSAVKSSATSTSKTPRQLAPPQSSHNKRLQNNASQQLAASHPSQFLKSSGAPVYSLPQRQQRVPNQQRQEGVSNQAPRSSVLLAPATPKQQHRVPNLPDQIFNPKSMPASPVPQQQRSAVQQKPHIKPKMIPQYASQREGGRSQQGNGQLQPNQMSTPRMTPATTPQQQYGLPQGQGFPQWQNGLPPQQYAEVSPIQAPRSSMAFLHGPQQPYVLQQPYGLQGPPNQSPRSNMPPPAVPQQQYGLPSQHYAQAQPNQMVGPNMLPPPMPAQQQGFQQAQYGVQQQQRLLVPPKTVIKLNMSSSPGRQPRPASTLSRQAAALNNPYEFTVDDVIKFVTKPFDILCFMSTFQIQNYIASHQMFSSHRVEEFKLPERKFKACRACPDWFWKAGGFGNFKHCTQCVVDSFERDWKLRSVLRWTDLYQQWIEIVAKSSLELSKKGKLMLEMRVRLIWLNERQEFIRLETLRMAKELELGHQLGVCMCQGVSVWVELKRPLSGLIVHRDSDSGVTFGDPAAHGDIDGGEKEVEDSEGYTEDDMDIDDEEGNAELVYPDIWGGSIEEGNAESVYPDIWGP